MKSIFILGLLFAFSALADDSVLIPSDQFLNQVLEAVKAFGGISWTLKIASIIMLIISSTKVSFVKPLWDKLGWVKSVVAPILGIIAGILLLTKEGNLSLVGVFAYCFAGTGAIVIHELLDGLKLIPGIGPTFVSVIDVFKSILKAPAPKTEIK